VTARSALDWAALRSEFPTLASWTYLDTARKAPMARCVEGAMREFTHDVYENAGATAWSARCVEETRSVMARLLGCAPESLAFTKNTTEGLNMASHCLDLKPGDNIVVTDMEHVANLWVWEHWRAKGCEIRRVQNRDGRLPVEAFLEKIDEKTRVVATAWVTYRNGYRVDLPELGRLCRAQGTRLVVDGVQGAGLLNMPVAELNADFVAMGGHKHLLGLNGTGLLYIRPELLTASGGDTIKPMSYVRSDPARSQEDQHDAHRFEGGNPNYLGLWAFRRSAAFIESIGIGNIEQRVRDLTDTFMHMLAKRGLRTQTPSNWNERCHIVNFPVAGDAQQVRAALREKRIVVNMKDGYLRASVGFFNTEEDIETLLRSLPA
jgi:selenocysteine lyase/cysteine desulfurase